MNAPLISVIIPVYNAEPYLRRCLDSVLAQTYGRLDIILINDGSKDRSGFICDEYAKRDGRFRVLHQENRGQSAARNAGLDIASGDCVGFVDADDWIYPDMYETLVRLLEETGADIAQCRYVSGDWHPRTDSSPAYEIRMFEGVEILRATFLEIVPLSLWDKLFRADLWKTLRLPEGYIYEDGMVLTELFSEYHRLVVTDKVGYFYDLSGPSTTRGQKDMRHLISTEKLCCIWEECIVRQNGADGNISMLICKNIPCYSWLIQENEKVDRTSVKEHRNRMHERFVRHYRAAKKSAKYREEPLVKKLLWRIYYHCPALSGFLVRVYHEGVRRSVK